MSRLPFVCFGILVLSAPLFAQEVKREDLKPGLIFTSTEGKTSLARLAPSVGITLKPGESAHPQLKPESKYTWNGYIQIVSAGTYQFDAVLLGKLTATIGDQKVMTIESKGKAASVAGAEIELKPGILPVSIELERNADAVQLDFYWRGPRFRREPIPYFFFGHTVQGRPESFLADSKRDHGRLLFEELACIKCHKADPNDAKANAMAKTLVERSGPNLSAIAERAYPGWIDAWLKDPQALRPHTAMPKLFADGEMGAAERYAVTAYLASLGKPLVESKSPNLKPDELKRSLDRGAKLYLLTGCASCHGDKLTGPPTKKAKGEDEGEDAPFKPEESFYGSGTATGAKSFYTLNHVGSKTKPEALAKWLKNPLETNPHGRMPNLQLSDPDALDLARFLCQTFDEKIAIQMPAEPKLKPFDLVIESAKASVVLSKDSEQWSAAGKALFESKGCLNCHEDQGGGKPMLANMRIPLQAKLPKPDSNEKGCLAEKPTAKAANYSLAKDQRAALGEFIKTGLTGAGTPSSVHSSLAAFKRFNCLNCHKRDGEGGIDSALADKMKALETSENADDVQPPLLTNVGHKMRTSHLKDVLAGNGRARPWMNLRMPVYGSANVGSLHEQIPMLEGTTTDDTVGKATFTKEKIEIGKALAGKLGLGCISCHDISGQRGGGTRGPDLATTNQRVRFDWYTRWMNQPQRMAPGTKMPQAFIEGKSLLTNYHDGDGDKQIESLWAYFALGPGLPLPAGLEPPKGLVIAVKDKPEILRTFMPDNAGTKCIAVGYPGGMNAVFDSSTCRLSYAWSGNFLDLSPVWNDRGGNPARVLGNKFWTAPVGHPWALVEGSGVPDFAKQAMDSPQADLAA